MKKMAERRNAQDKRKAKIGESKINSDLEDDAESTHRPEGPGSRPLPPEAYCFKKTLNSNTVNPIVAWLYIDPHEACALVVCDEIVKHREGSFGRMLEVFDEQDRFYKMELKGYVTGKVVSCSIAGDWKKYVRNYNLMEGDEVTFYKNRDRSISDNDYFIVKVTNRKADDRKEHFGTKRNTEKSRTLS